MSGLALASRVPIVGTWVLVVGTLAFAYGQLRQNRPRHSTSTLLDHLRERFYGPRLRAARRELSAWLLRSDRGEEPDNWELALFFAFVGTLARSRILETGLVRRAFGTWVRGCYTFVTRPVDPIARWRNDSHDALVLGDFEWLARKVIEIERRAARAGPEVEASLREGARYLLEGDSRLSLAAA